MMIRRSLASLTSRVSLSLFVAKQQQRMHTLGSRLTRGGGGIVSALSRGGVNSSDNISKNNNFSYCLISIRTLKERAGKSVKPGTNLVVENVPHRVTKIMQGKRGKGGGFVKATLKNLITGFTHEQTFTSDEMVEHADLEKEAVQYSWSDGQDFIFMNSLFEEVRLSKESVDKQGQFLLEGQEVKLLKFKDAVIGLELPTICEYTVESLDESKSIGSNCPAVLNCGATVLVPLFIKEGTRIRVNTEEHSYVDRA